jgi:predicted nucleic acid-binding protein
MPQSSESRYYFDANALFKFYQNEVGSLKIRRLVARVESPILLSPLTVLECFGIAVKRHRQRQFRTGQVKQMFKHFQKDVGDSLKPRPFALVPWPAEVFKIAENILLQHGGTFDIGPNDALHLAIVKQLPLTPSPILVTSDRSMQHIGGRLGIGIYDPEME